MPLILSKYILEKLYKNKYNSFWGTLAILAGIALIGCKEEKLKGKEPNKADVVFKIFTSSDTVQVNEYLKCYAFLEVPHFKDKDSGIMIFVENDKQNSLKKDLTNEYDLDMDVFLNLTNDTINQKWLDQYNFDRTAVFGKKFESAGRKTMRGYILEYKGKVPPFDSCVDPKKIKKYYFEREIYVINSLKK